MSDKQKLALVLGRVCALQGQYGKTAAELETLVEGFCWVLGHYPMQVVIDAIGEHIRRSRDIPTPADIEAIINPPRPKPDWAVYVALKKKVHEGYYPLSDERKFIADCEQHAVSRNAEELAGYNEAQRQLAQFRQAITYSGDDVG